MTAATKRILVATDFSEASDEAFGHALELAKLTGATLELVHVLELGDSSQFPYGLINYVGNPGALAAFVDRELAVRAERATAAGLRCYTRMLEGGASQEIVREAREARADFVVLGTHGRRGLAHALLGSVAERVVQHAGCPVLTVPFSKKAA
ncbi:MAG TPA: universal stress protein [Polyangia bacterium]|nr:universal stress protein [Polyangia bacterium]